jgi:hypothetical protein
MNIFDVVVDTDDLVVLGSPSVMDVTFDIGATGQRGSKIFIGAGDPASYDFGSEQVYENDMFINAYTASPTYAWLYAYVAGPTGNQWSQVLKMQPAKYLSNTTATFTNGVASFSLPLITMFGSEAVIDANQYSISVTPQTTNPSAISVISKAISGAAGSRVLTFTVNMITGTLVATPVWSRATGSQPLLICVEVVGV